MIQNGILVLVITSPLFSVNAQIELKIQNKVKIPSEQAPITGIQPKIMNSEIYRNS